MNGWSERRLPAITVVDGVRMATPLLVVILLIGVVDVIFAVDSIPAIFAITTDPFIVLTSTVFAILGLRAMYFLLAGMHERFHLPPPKGAAGGAYPFLPRQREQTPDP